MKSLKNTILFLCAAGCGLSLCAAEKPNQSGDLLRASRVIGLDVRDRDDAKLGDVKDLVVDLHGGRIVATVLSAGHLLGVPDRLVAIPGGELGHGAGTGFLKFSGRRDSFQTASSFDQNSWPDFSNRSQLAGTPGPLRRNGEIREAAGASRETAKAAPARASEIIGMTVKNRQEQKLGDVKEMVVDWQSGRISYLVLSVGGFLGLGDKLIAVAPSSLQASTDGRVLILDATRESLKAAKSFEAAQWPETRKSEPVLYGGISGKRISEAAGTGKVSRKDAPTASDQSDDRDDVETTKRIRQALIANKSLSIRARNVKVITREGTVTVRGAVQNESEHQAVLSAAWHGAGPDRVDDQLDIKERAR